jgi:hypothetical protein
MALPFYFLRNSTGLSGVAIYTPFPGGESLVLGLPEGRPNAEKPQVEGSHENPPFSSRDTKVDKKRQGTL